MAMLDGVTELTLDFLNEATQAWVEIEYNRAVHRETASCAGRALRPRARRAPLQPFQRVAPRRVSPGDQAEAAAKRRHDLAGGRAVRGPGTLSPLPRS